MALIDTQKLQFMNDVRAVANLCKLVRQRSAEIAQKWTSLGFGSGGANEFTSGDMTGTVYDGLPVAALTNCVTTLEAFETWINAGHDDNLQKIME